MIWDLNCQIKSSEESKVVHLEEKSEDLNEQKIELDIESKHQKCKHQINKFNWMELSITINTIKAYLMLLMFWL